MTVGELKKTMEGIEDDMEVIFGCYSEGINMSVSDARIENTKKYGLDRETKDFFVITE